MGFGGDEDGRGWKTAHLSVHSSVYVCYAAEKGAQRSVNQE
jgi:hypothetical protein